MNTDFQFNDHLDRYYDALAMDDIHTQNIESGFIFGLILNDLIQNSSGRYFTITNKTRSQEMNGLLDAYRHRVRFNADAWSTIEAEIMSNINIYNFNNHLEQNTPIRIKAVIDWLDLSFEVNPDICSFANKANARSYIKSFLTSKTGTRHYVKNDDSDINQNGFTFTIRLHDIKSKEDLFKITHLLEVQYGAEFQKMKISAIELSLDFYRSKSRNLLSALHKSLRYCNTAENFRIYKYVKNDARSKFTPIPQSPLALFKRFNNDWCLGVNPKGSPLCYRLYPKTTDSNKKPLPINEHRLRVEVTLSNDLLKDTDCHLSNLINIIKLGFKHLTFTKLDEKASKELKAKYNQNIDHFGMEQNTISKNRNKRTLAEGIKPHSELNSLVAKAVFNLSRKF